MENPMSDTLGKCKGHTGQDLETGRRSQRGIIFERGDAKQC